MMNHPTIRPAIAGLILFAMAVVPFGGRAQAAGYGAHHQTVLHMRTLHALTALAHAGSLRTLPMTFTSRRTVRGHGSSGENSGGPASRFARRANVTDPTTLFVDPADWNNTEFWTFMAAGDLDNAQFNPMREFHKTGYTGSGLISNGECGQDANGDPYSFVCSGFLQEEIIAIQTNHTIQANYVGSVYTSSSKATARYQDALKANGAKNGVSCGLASQGVPNCESWLYRFTNTNNIVVAWGIYTGFQYGNAFGETVAFISPADYNNGNGSKFQTFVSDSSNLDIDALGAFLFMTNNAKITLSNPLQVATPFSLWPVGGVASAVGLKPSDADNTKTNPLRAFHSKSYTSSGMLGNRSCGNNSQGHPLPKKCGGLFQTEILPIGSSDSHTFSLSFTGTLYGSVSEALNQFKDSTAAKGTSCGITAGGVPVPNCKVVQSTVTSGGQKLEKIYGAVPFSNGLAEVLAVVPYSDFQNHAKQSAILGDFFAVFRGGLSNL